MHTWSPLDLNTVLNTFGDNPKFTRGIIAVSKPGAGAGLLHSIRRHIAGRPHNIFHSVNMTTAPTLSEFLFDNKNKIVVLDGLWGSDSEIANIVCAAASGETTITYRRVGYSRQFDFNGIVIIPCYGDIRAFSPTLITRCIELNFG